ncbi:hypothetical protein KDA_01640 [Dictyobacter alpinus]|uniref:Uncharacterized protein n=1 Tax=Dictyobacter alpinus TaxID=2014873 RepID=A0A402B014_9CHLR|nr:hypothetical protein KDA_01640 [Dictyobacter alpinus]
MLPCRVCPQTSQPFLALGKDGIVELTGGFQVGTHASGLPGINH